MRGIRVYFVLMMALLGQRGLAQEQRTGPATVMHQPPEVDFAWLNACLGDSTKFINGSIRANTYTWTVYNKSLSSLYTSNNVDIKYLFPTADTFYVELIADNGHITSSMQMVLIDSLLKADFNFMHCSNQFLSHSSCADSVFWDFGDGSTSNVSVPVHQYADTGYYTVKLKAYKGNLTDSAIKQIFVDPLAFPTGAFTWYLSNDTLYVHAVDSMAGMFYNWNFGDFTPHAYVRDTFHVYADTGTYILNFGDWNTCSTFASMDTVRYYLNSIASHTTQPLNLFPNPTSGHVNLTLPGAVETRTVLELRNAVGQIVDSGNFAYSFNGNSAQLNLQDLPVGIYYLRIIGQTRTLSARIVRTRE